MQEDVHGKMDVPGRSRWIGGGVLAAAQTSCGPAGGRKGAYATLEARTDGREGKAWWSIHYTPCQVGWDDGKD